jgi:hypothetical protein
LVEEPQSDGDVEHIARWTAHVRLLQRAVEIARMAGATREELWAVAEREGCSRTEWASLLFDPDFPRDGT